MNIFVLSDLPEEAAEFHCNKHVCKMILEAGQMLCTAHWFSQIHKKGKSMSDFKRVRDAQDWLLKTVPSQNLPPWKMTHVGHPCNVWTRESLDNYRWHSKLGLALCSEYTRRYGKVHKSLEVHEWLSRNEPLLPSLGKTEHPQCVPEDCKTGPGSAVEAYRQYYNRYKNKFAAWEPRTRTPNWYTGK